MGQWLPENCLPLQKHVAGVRIMGTSLPLQFEFYSAQNDSLGIHIIKFCALIKMFRKETMFILIFCNELIMCLYMLWTKEG
jgi:hypothetical protein